MSAQIMAVLIDPALQRRPRRQQRLVGHLDGGCTGEAIGIERQQPVVAEAFDHGLHRHRVDGQRRNLARGHATAAALVAVADRHEAEAQLASRLLLLLVEFVEQVGGPPLQRAIEAPHRSVRRCRQHVAGAAVEQLGERVLEQRKCPRLVPDVRDQLAEQGRLEGHAVRLGGAESSGLEFLRRQLCDVDDARAEPSAELGVRQLVRVEVGAQRQHDADAAVGIVDGGHEVRQEPLADRWVVDEREQLLELVDDQHEVRVVAGQDPQRSAEETRVAVAELLAEAGRSVHRRAQQRCVEFGEWVGARQHAGHEPSVRALDRSLGQRRNQSGAHDTRLPRPAGTDQRDQALAAAEVAQDLRSQCVTAEERRGIVGSERPQPLERVGRRPLGTEFRCRAAGLDLLVVEQDVLLQTQQPGRRVDAEFVADVTAEPPDCPQRLGRSPRAVQRQGQVLDEPFAQRVLLAQQFEFADDLAVEPACQVGFDPVLDRVDTGVAEADALEVGELLVGVVLERRAVPEVECGAELSGGRGGIVGQQRASCGSPPFERLDVELTRIHIESVAGANGLEHRLLAALAVGIECCSQPRDIHAQGIELAVALVTPELLEDPIRRQHLAVVDEQEGDHGLLAGRPQIDRHAVARDRDGAECSELHVVHSITPRLPTD